MEAKARSIGEVAAQRRSRYVKGSVNAISYKSRPAPVTPRVFGASRRDGPPYGGRRRTTENSRRAGQRPQVLECPAQNAKRQELLTGSLDFGGYRILGSGVDSFATARSR